MAESHNIRVSGLEDGKRIESRILEERLQSAVRSGAEHIEVDAFGQHGIGGRLWQKTAPKLHLSVYGSPGQRLGSMGFPGTTIEVFGPASDDTGWLNTGADIIIHGNATNGTANAMAQGRIWVDGGLGARGMTMTKHNPRHTPPELWVLGGVGDSFAEFMAGGIAVICGIDPADPENVLGYRPCVGMVGGSIYFRGPHKGFSQADAKLIGVDDERWAWLSENLMVFLERIGRPELFEILGDRSQWQCLVALSPHEKMGKKRRSMADFRANAWDAELGRGGLIGDLTDLDRSPIPLIPTGEMRRFVPVWENRRYEAPCQANCPTGIPVRKRWKLIRAGKVQEAMDLCMSYTPLPATVCGHLCPNLCMEGCTRTTQKLIPVDVKAMGKASLKARDPELPESSGHKVAVVGGGPAGLSVAWQLRLLGHEPVVFDRDSELGGKIAAAIPDSRIPADVLGAELERVRRLVMHVQLDEELDADAFTRLMDDFDFVVLAAGAQTPRVLPVPGKERLVTALDFLRGAKHGGQQCGERLVIIGAGNVGCDVAAVGATLGARDITLIDVQEPASFGKEREEAEKVGATFRWPCFTKEITAEGVVLSTGEVLPADTVVISIGDAPDLGFLPDSIATERGFVTVNDVMQTTDPKVFAIGDIVRPGLITQAIGDGRRAAVVMDAILSGKRPLGDAETMSDDIRARLGSVDDEGRLSEMIDYSRITLEYFDPRVSHFQDLDDCAAQCSSCGECRDCGLCETLCPQGAITRQSLPDGDFEMIADPAKCIGCGFCADACPCGIWALVKNTPLG